MTNMVSRFRVKKLSPKHPLPVYKESQLPDLVDPANIIQRAVPQIETGVEKEEEEEHDLQAAISAAQAAVTTGATVQTYIPTPDASNVIDAKEFSKLYKKKYKEPSTLIRFSSTVEDTTGCPYVMDEDDDVYYKKHKNSLSLSEDDFEKLMWEFESITNQQLPHLHLDVSHIPEYEDFLLLVPNNSMIHNWAASPQLYEHWKERRIKRGGKSIIPVLAYEDVLKHEIDPYVCFRRRETKPVRKTRRTDQQSLERLRKLRSEMEMARNLLEMVLRREKIRKEGLVLEHAVFDKTCRARECQRILDIKEDEDFNQILLSKKKRKVSSAESGSGTTIKIPLSRLKRDASEKFEKSPLQLQIEAELSRKRERDALYEDVTEYPYQPFPKPLSSLFYQQLSLSSPNDKNNNIKQSSIHHTSGGPRYRRRMGRGGRVFIDRIGFRSKSSQPTVSSGGKNGISGNMYEFDMDSESDDSDWEYDMMNESHLQHRTRLLGESDLRNLITLPFMQPFNSMSNLRSGQPQQKQLDQQQQQQQQQQQRIALQSTNANTSLPSPMTSSSSSNSVNNTLPPSSSSSSAGINIKQQQQNNNSSNNNNRINPQQAAATHMMNNDMYGSNGTKVENGPAMPTSHIHGSSTPRSTTHVS
ncbi:enhancer of polycomb-like-domain-containing protein [Halteromyces radiatus]|uniref:enhancer of polycomb-like-domain-containing protein n=1 Tax=Halteromyces radiatus TaxID=101107 RepID=UPI00221E7414|nr:enhancer of polycomb-like-domain-containing protein [Halteromyces radiatus]KAI8089418.1 enhancer of polycomb-like-domain-containing protein [Halteromyces radiatus]